MARVQNTLIGRASGSVGQVVFLTWRLINVTRSKPSSVANPDTILQQQQRNRFGATVELYRILKDILAVGLKNRNRKMTLFNFFQYLNQQKCFDNVGDGTVAFLPENLIVSYGKNGGVNNLKLLGANGGPSVQFTWIDLPLPDGFTFNDKVYAAVFNENSGQWGVYSAASNFRNLQFLNLIMPSNQTTGDVLHGFIFFKNPETGLVSTSQYVTDTV